MDFYTIFIYFFIYSVLGWCTEMIYCAICQGKFVDRGFLYGPYCPIYGFGALIVTLILKSFANNPIKIFFIGMFLCTLLEYITSFVMEKLFNAKWWDYSQFKLNIHGRVCLLNSLEFGFLGIILNYLIHPNIEKLIQKIPINCFPIITYILIFIIIVDLTLTLITVLNLKEKLQYIKELSENIKKKYNYKISDLELFKELEDVRINILNKANKFGNRLLYAFPNLKFKNLNKQLSELKIELHKKRLKIKNMRMK